MCRQNEILRFDQNDREHVIFVILSVSEAFLRADRMRFFARLDEAAVVDSEEVRPGIILDYDANDNVVGVEILGLSTSVEPQTLNSIQLEAITK